MGVVVGSASGLVEAQLQWGPRSIRHKSSKSSKSSTCIRIAGGIVQLHLLHLLLLLLLLHLLLTL